MLRRVIAPLVIAPLAGLLLLLLALPGLAAGFANLERMTDQGFLISAEARLLDGGGELLGAIEPQRQLSPASVSKIYLAAAALERWGPQHRFTSELKSSAEIDADGVLQGDLIFEGGGDPALVSEELWKLVQLLRQRGVRGINGQLVVSQWRFGPVACVTRDRCDTVERSANTYSALLSSAGVNYGSWCMNVHPGASVGDAARVVSCDTVEPVIGINNQVTTVATGNATELNAERVTDAGGDTMILRGQIAANAHPREVYRASSNPAGQTAQTLLALLAQAGIEVAGDAAGVPYVTSTVEPNGSARRLAAVDGKPLQELVLRTMNYSNNFMADVLNLGLVPTPQTSLEEAAQALEAYAAAIPGHGPVTLHSGSGLTTTNRTSAAGVNALLEHAYHRPSLFPHLLASMQTPTNGPSRFIRRGSERFQNNVMLKTGTLNQPFAVRSVGGYFRTDSGRWGVFTALVNGTSSTPWLNWTQVLEPLAEDLDAMIRDH
ncbi:D-alanyl-D-alanine carboxypeptidase / D-alanyl-D-alanine-endopeptidase (penicillin-binding protein 4) [Franzmannia pantelleriensis]|uniref:D-alanyl-D-alanine carboxypeptidase / D-alanyl-D-alanine-endopeptidase (Penicillin-binding protein 4) n=1 Tax=Franzmannia pantelleriensis TaxID=48727 RepID=A0A1G9SPF0_9GAMM|nr:D-alanyl-D-alanine carboxypeptidase/D-alanyl-D-alanine-endopeptidase [Halomonas pantelleriensis]SDM37237.1 D-alanyl-D-alanine carboxypeptidase / D-alanyl-D-alanine-endopeptidase (penicillin-binding protein 4) [Halomonas pantelleriensis]